MADTVTIKKITDLPENTDANDADLFMQGVNGTASLRKIKWSTILAKIKSKLLANNLTTTQEGYALDARQGKALSDQINALNTNFEDITSKFNWGTSTNYKAYRIGKVVVFSAMCNAKSAEAMNFATILDSDLQPIAFTPLEAYTGLGADFLNRVTAYVTGNTVTARSYDGYSSAAGKALQGSIIVNGTWIIN